MARIRSNRVCFTVNNYEVDYPEQLHEYVKRNEANIQFLVVGEEIGAKGTPHLQGFIHLKNNPKECGVKFWRNELPYGPTTHFAAARGTDEQNEEYCTKDGPYFKFGETAVATDKWKKLIDTAMMNLNDCMEIDSELFLRHYHQLKAIHEDNNHPKMAATLERLREWQEKVIAKLKHQSDREILFVVDEEGGKGKSALAKHLMTTYNAWACQGGKINDLMYAYEQGAEYVIFDMARCNNPDYFPWNFMENLKNGWFTSTKYKGGMKMFNAPKIVVFMNEMPPRNKLSADRYNVFVI